MSSCHRFDVDFKQRLTQSRTACNAVRLPRLGYELYRIYAIEDDYKRADVKMTLSKGRQHSKTYTGIQKIYTLWVDEYFKHDVAYEVKWLKPKKTTLLRMHGHRVEPAEPGDKVGHVGPIKTPVRLGR